MRFIRVGAVPAPPGPINRDDELLYYCAYKRAGSTYREGVSRDALPGLRRRLVPGGGLLSVSPAAKPIAVAHPGSGGADWWAHDVGGVFMWDAAAAEYWGSAGRARAQSAVDQLPRQFGPGPAGSASRSGPAAEADRAGRGKADESGEGAALGDAGEGAGVPRPGCSGNRPAAARADGPESPGSGEGVLGDPRPRLAVQVRRDAPGNLRPGSADPA